MKEKLISFKDSVISQKKLMVVILLIIGLGVSVYLVQSQQIFKSRAALDVNHTFEIKDDQGNIIRCEGAICHTESFNITIKVKDLESLQK